MFKSPSFTKFSSVALFAVFVSFLLVRPAHGSPLKTLELKIKPIGLNPSPVVVSVAMLQKQFPDFDPKSFVVLVHEAKTAQLHVIPSQADDLDGDGKPEEIAFELEPSDQTWQSVTLEYGDTRSIAPLRSTASSQAHALFAKRYEGLGWENDRVAWRLYFDKRNAIDLYAKRQFGLALDYFAKPSVNYHRESPIGRDVYDVGNAIGIGSIAAWDDGKVVRVSDVTDRQWKVLADGPVRAMGEVTYQGWKMGGKSVDLTSRFTIWAGHHFFIHDIKATNAADLTLVTGLPKKDGITLLASPNPLLGKQHRFIATWGAQVQPPPSAKPSDQKLGLAVLMSHGPISKTAESFTDVDNHLIAVSLRTQGAITTGRFAVLADWDQEAPDAKLPNAVQSSDAWQQYLEALSPAVFTTATVQIETAGTNATVSVPPVTPMTLSDPLSRSDVIAAMKHAYDFQLSQQATQDDHGWIRATFYTGVMALYQTTHDQKYLDQALAWANASHWTTAGNRPLFADNQCCIQTYAELAELQKAAADLKPAIVAFDKQIALTKPGREQWFWADSLFMSPPALARLAVATKDARYFTLLNTLWWDSTEFLYDKNEHLFYRDKRFFAQKTKHGSSVFWSRGNGWVMAGTVRVLDSLPESDPNRGRFIALHQEMAAKIASLQGEDGLWRVSLLDSDQYSMPETSGTAFFTYALAWGINHKTLDRKTYLSIVQKAWIGLVGKLEADGRLGYVQGPGAAPAAFKPETTADYAVGAFLLAGSEMAKLSDH